MIDKKKKEWIDLDRHINNLYSKSNLASDPIDNKSIADLHEKSCIEGITLIDKFLATESAQKLINYTKYVSEDTLKDILLIIKNKKIPKKPKNNTKKTKNKIKIGKK